MILQVVSILIVSSHDAVGRNPKQTLGMYKTCVNTGIYYLQVSTGAGFLPSTIFHHNFATNSGTTSPCFRVPMLHGIYQYYQPQLESSSINRTTKDQTPLRHLNSGRVAASSGSATGLPASEVGAKWMFPKIRGTSKSSILIGFSIINHPFWGISPYFWKHPNSW